MGASTRCKLATEGAAMEIRTTGRTVKRDWLLARAWSRAEREKWRKQNPGEDEGDDNFAAGSW